MSNFKNSVAIVTTEEQNLSIPQTRFYSYLLYAMWGFVLIYSLFIAAVRDMSIANSFFLLLKILLHEIMHHIIKK